MPRVDPLKNFNFRLEIDGIQIAGFTEVTGLDSEVDCIEYREGVDGVIRKLLGLPRFGNITLRRGVTTSLELYNWHRDILSGTLDRRTVVVVLQNDQRADVARWVISDAFPRKYEGPRLNARGNEVAIESLELCCEGIERVV